MKKIILVSLLSLFAFSVNADDGVVTPATVVKITQKANPMPGHIGPKPVRTELIVELEACQTLTASNVGLDVEVDKESKSVLLTITQPSIDCMGMTRKQTVKLVSTKVPVYNRVFVKNPLLIDFQIVH